MELTFELHRRQYTVVVDNPDGELLIWKCRALRRELSVLIRYECMKCPDLAAKIKGGIYLPLHQSLPIFVGEVRNRTRFTQADFCNLPHDGQDDFLEWASQNPHLQTTAIINALLSIHKGRPIDLSTRLPLADAIGRAKQMQHGSAV